MPLLGMGGVIALLASIEVWRSMSTGEGVLDGEMPFNRTSLSLQASFSTPQAVSFAQRSLFLLLGIPMFFHQLHSFRITLGAPIK
jgi:hypothetical protein